MKQIRVKKAGAIAVAALKVALDQAGINDFSTRTSLIGFFWNAWNTQLAPIEILCSKGPLQPMQNDERKTTAWGEFETKFRQLLGEVDPKALSEMSLDLPGGVTKLATSNFFVYEVDGEEVILTDESIQKIEAAIGPLERKRFQYFELQESLVFPESTRKQIWEFFDLHGIDAR